VDEIQITATSGSRAIAPDIVLRQTKTTRLAFRPVFDRNDESTEAVLRGQFYFQRRAIETDDWDDCDSLSLASVKAGQKFNNRLARDELLAFFRGLRTHPMRTLSLRVRLVVLCMIGDLGVVLAEGPDEASEA